MGYMEYAQLLPRGILEGSRARSNRQLPPCTHRGAAARPRPVIVRFPAATRGAAARTRRTQKASKKPSSMEDGGHLEFPHARRGRRALSRLRVPTVRPPTGPTGPTGQKHTFPYFGFRMVLSLGSRILNSGEIDT